MDQCEVTLAQRQGQISQVVNVIRGQMLGGPLARGGRFGIEVRGIYVAYGCRVVVACNSKVSMLTQKPDAFPGVRAVADHVAEAPQLINCSSSM